MSGGCRGERGVGLGVGELDKGEREGEIHGVSGRMMFMIRGRRRRVVAGEK